MKNENNENENNENNDPDSVYSVKFIIIGDKYVGKTKIIHRLVYGKYSNPYISTIGMDFLIHPIQIKNNLFNLQIWDTAGSERYRSITKTYYLNSTCAIIVYDITDNQSFESIKSWVEECKSYNNPNIHLVLVGNKNDLEDKRVISKEKGEKLAVKFGMKFFESSALTGDNINEIFTDACKTINKNIDNRLYDLEEQTNGIKLCKTNNKKDIKTDIINSPPSKKLDKKNISKEKNSKCNC